MRVDCLDCCDSVPSHFDAKVVCSGDANRALIYVDKLQQYTHQQSCDLNTSLMNSYARFNGLEIVTVAQIQRPFSIISIAVVTTPAGCSG
jgi:hypothetical protein